MVELELKFRWHNSDSAILFSNQNWLILEVVVWSLHSEDRKIGIIVFEIK